MKKLTILLLMLAGFGLTGNAMAENGHAYNGSYCKAYYGNQASSFQFKTAGVKNVSGSTRWMTCPVLVDEIANTKGTTRVWLRYTGTGKITCTLYSKYANGNTFQSKTGSRVGSGWFNIPQITKDRFWGNYTMFCTIPSQGTLNTIWLGEKN